MTASSPRRVHEFRRDVTSHDTTSIADLITGTTVRVRGRVVARGPVLRSPIGNRACAAFVTFATVGGRDIHRETRLTSFVLESERGSVRIECPEGTELVVRLDIRRWGRDALSDQAMRRWMAARDPGEEKRLDPVPTLAADFECGEGTIEPGEIVEVLGTTGIEPNPEYRGGGVLYVRATHVTDVEMPENSALSDDAAAVRHRAP